MSEDLLKVVGVNSRGYGIVPKLIMTDRRLHVIAKAIYSYMCSYAGSGTVAFPSRDKLCYDLNISKDTLTKYLKQLQDTGYVKITQNKIKGKFSNNVYELIAFVNADDLDKNVDTSTNDRVNNIENTTKSTVAENIGHGSIGYDEMVTNNNNININKNNIGNKIAPVSDINSKTNKRLTTKKASQQCEDIWKLYPNKKGKAEAMKKLPGLVNTYGIEQLERAIDRYQKTKEVSNGFIQHGDRFFKSSIYDYLDENYEQAQEQDKPKSRYKTV